MTPAGPRDRARRPPATSAGSDLGRRLAEAAGSRRATHRYRTGQALFYEGAPAHALFILRSGRAKVFRTGRAGEVQVLRLLGPGEVLGYRPLLAGEPYGASAELVEDAEVCIVPADEVRRILRGSPALAEAMLAKLAVELRLSEELLMDVAHRPVRQRVARVLLALVEDNRGAARPARVDGRHLRRQDLARMAGTTPETLSRVLRAFAEAGWVTLDRAWLEVRDARRLARVAALGEDDAS